MLLLTNFKLLLSKYCLLLLPCFAGFCAGRELAHAMSQGRTHRMSQSMSQRLNQAKLVMTSVCFFPLMRRSIAGILSA